MIVSLLASTYSVSKTKGALCLLSLALLASPAWTQTQLGTLFGTITDSTGAVLPGVKITFLNSGTGLNRDSTADAKGQYHLAGLPYGMYSVRIEKEGFQTEIRQGVELMSPAALTVNGSLREGTAKEQVVVEAESATVDNISSTIRGVIPEHCWSDCHLYCHR